MDDDLARLQVRISAETSRFDQGINRTSAVFDRAARSVESRAAQMNTRMVRATSAFGGMGMAAQQAGFQIGDFAVQVASGQGVLRPFIQQGTQLISMFGPWGAVIGAAGAVVGALATTLWDAEESTGDADKALDELAQTSGEVEGAIDSLIGVVEAYADAITGTADASDAATARIIANTRAEFAARQQLLRLDTFDARQQQFAREDKIKELRGQETEIRQAGDFSTAFEEERLRASIPKEMTSETPALTEARRRAIERAAEAARQAQDISRQASRLEATSVLAAQQLEEADRILGMTFEDVVADVQEGRANRAAGRKRGGGGRKEREPSDVYGESITDLREKIELLDQQRDLIGRTEAQQAQLTAAFERQNMVDAVLKKAREEDLELTPQQIAQVEQHAAAVESLTLANFYLEQELEQQADAAAEAQKRQEDLAKAITDTADRFISAVQLADSFADALKRIGLELLDIAAQGLQGQGPLGGLLGNLIPSLFGIGAHAPTTAPIPIPRPNALGNAFSGGNVIPFARGGVIDQATIAPMALMGEAGPEAILPLKRGPGGRLGVEGGGGGTVVNVYAPPGSSVREERSQSGGMEQVSLFIEQVVAGGISTPGSKIQRALSTGFGARPVTTKR